MTLLAAALAACGSKLPELNQATGDQRYSTRYRVAPGDTVTVFVWRNPEITTSVPVRPDGFITAPLMEEIPAAGKTPSELARDLEEALSVYVRDPLVTVMVNGFVGDYADQIRVLGEASQPKALLYRDSMTLLDVMIQVGGLTQFAAGNEATIARKEEGELEQFRVRIDDLIKDGDITANVDMKPGDILIIPEAWF
ncbi:MAG: polysaccharide export protein [Chromatiales bacterium]|jgi:polysaccharide export outer membrane protein